MSNPRGQQRDKPFRDALRLEVAAAQDENDSRSLRRIARELLAVAADGDVSAIKEIADRLDGKVPQAIGGTDELDPVRMIVTGVPRNGEMTTEAVDKLQVALLGARPVDGRDD